MKEMKIMYSPVSPSHQEKRDRFQLISVSFGIVVGFWETLNVYKGISLVIPIFGFFVALVNIIVARFFSKFKNKFGEKFDILLFKLNGMVMIITGIGLHINGSQYCKYIYYLLALYFIIILPYFLLPAMKRKLIIHCNYYNIVIHKLIFKPVVYSWNQIESIIINKNFIEVKKINSKKIKKYYFFKSDINKFSEIKNFFHEIKLKKNYTFEIKS